MTAAPESARAGLSRREAWVAIPCAAAALAAVVLISWRAGFLLSNDGPAQLYNAVAATHLQDPAFAPFVVANPNVTGRGFPELIAWLEPALGWRAAYRVALAGIAALSFLSVLALVVAAAPRRWWLGVAAAPLAFQHATYIGLLHYQLGAALGVLAIAWWLRRHRSLADVCVAALLLYASAAAHAFAGIFAGGACLLLSIHHGRRSVVAIVLAGIPAAMVALLARETQAGAADPDVWPSLQEHVALVLGFVPGPLWRSLPFWAAGVVAALATLRAARTRPQDAALAGAGLALLMLAAVGPRDYAGWQLMGLRPLPFAAALLLAAVDVEGLGSRARTLWRSGAVLWLLASLVWLDAFHEGLRQRFDPVVDRVQTLARVKPALRGTLTTEQDLEDSSVPLFTPYRRLASLVTVQAGGVVAGFYGRPADVVALRAQPHAAVPSQAENDATPPQGDPGRQDWVRRLAALNVPIGALVAIGTRADLDTVEAAGWTREQRVDADDGKGILLAHFDGCTAHVRAPAPGPLEVGFSPMEHPLLQAPIEGEATLPGLGCGPMWFRFPTPCREAGGDGRVRATLSRQAVTEVPCTPP